MKLDLTAVEEGIRRASRKGFFVGVPLLVVAAAMVLFVPVPSDREQVVMNVLGGIFGALALFILFRASHQPKRNAALGALRDSPSDVVWIYAHRDSINGVHALTWLHVGMADGSMHKAPVYPLDADEAQLRSLARSLPQVTVGYSPEIEAQFRSNPKSLASTPASGHPAPGSHAS